MKRFVRKKTVKIALLIIAFLATSLGSAFAATNLEPVNAFFNHGISFVLNGDRWQPKNETGERLTAIHYNGNNYLPVRAIAEALKIPIDYDGDTDTIYIGGIPGKKTPIFAMPLEIDNIYVTRSKDPKETLINEKQFQEAFKIDQYGDIYFTLDRKYKRLVLDAAIISPGEHDVEFTLYNAGEAAGNTSETVLEKHTISPKDGIRQMVFHVEGLEKMKLHVQSPELNPYIYARIVDTSFFDYGESTAKESSK